MKRQQEEKMEELQPVGAELFWYEEYIYLYVKFIVLSANKDYENVQIFNEKMFRILKQFLYFQSSSSNQIFSVC